MLKSINPTTTEAWSKLEKHYQELKDKKLKTLFKEDDVRVEKLAIKWEDFYVDFSKNLITKETLSLLKQLTEEVGLEDAKQQYFSGSEINATEKRAVLHTALRSKEEAIFFNEKNIIPEIEKTKTKIQKFSNSITSGTQKGYIKKAFKTIVNIGIGGSDLGPSMVVEALQFYRNHLDVKFVSNVDGDHVNEVIKDLDPETTLFVIVSKSFGTQETLSNATTIREWFLKQLPQEAVKHHFVAVSSNIEKVVDFGIDNDNIFPMWNWVGGRFSLWSAVGLSISLAVGYDHFSQLLDGASKMDTHFNETPFEENLPTIAACLSVWYNNFFNAETEAVICYSQYLNQFATYLQQAIMESNGKYVDRNGNKVNYQTGNIVWGEPGTNSQHAFFQLIHQGTKLIPADFIGFVESLYKNDDHHKKLIANFIAQTEALMVGKSLDQISDTDELIKPFKVFEGNKPTTTLFIQKLTPESLGKLIAYYEHKIFVQGVIWNIYSYDQFGVELGKQLANDVLSEFEGSKSASHDNSTKALVNIFKRGSV